MKKYISMFLAVIICLSAFVGCVENGGNKPVADLPPAETPPRNEPTADEPDEPITDEPSADEPIDPSVTPTEPTEPQQPVEPENPTEPSEPVLPDVEDFPKYDPELFENIIAVDVERGLYVSRADGTVWRGQLYVDEDFNFDKAEFELSSQVPAKKLGAERYANVIITENGDLLGDFEKVIMENVVDAEMTLFDGWALCEDGTLWIYRWDTMDNPTKYAENIAEYCDYSSAITKDRELVNITRQEDGSYVSVVLLQGKKIKSAMGGLAIDENNTLWTTGGKKIAENARFIKSGNYGRNAFAVTENNELWINGNNGAEKIANDVSDAYYCRIDGMGEVYFLISPDGELSYIKNGERIVIAEKVWQIIPHPLGIYSANYIEYLDNNGRAWTYFFETEEKRLDMENVVYAESGTYTFYICADGTLWADGRLLLSDVKLPATTEPSEPVEPEKPVEPSTPTEPSEPVLPDVEDFPKYDPQLFESIIAVDVERGLYVSRADGTVWRGRLYDDEVKFELVSQVPAKKLGAERYINVIITENGELLDFSGNVIMENVVGAGKTIVGGWVLCEDGTLWDIYDSNLGRKITDNIEECCAYEPYGYIIAISKDGELVTIGNNPDDTSVTVHKSVKNIKDATRELVIDENNTVWTTGGEKIVENARFIKSDDYGRNAFAVTENNELWIKGNNGAEKIANDVSDAYYCRIDRIGEDYFLISPDGELSYIKNGERIVIAEKVWQIIPHPLGIYSANYIEYLDNNGRAWTYFFETEEKRLDMENVVYAESGTYTFYICADGTLWADGRLLLTDVKLPATTEPTEPAEPDTPTSPSDIG